MKYISSSAYPLRLCPPPANFHEVINPGLRTLFQLLIQNFRRHQMKLGEGLAAMQVRIADHLVRYPKTERSKCMWQTEIFVWVGNAVFEIMRKITDRGRLKTASSAECLAQVGWRKTEKCLRDFRNLYYPKKIIRILKSGRVCWAGRWQMYTHFCFESLKRSFGRSRLRR